MMDQIPFYQLFYGLEFHRYFTRPKDFKSKSKFQIQFTVKDAKQLYLHVHRNSGFHPCYASIYDYGSKDNLNMKKPGPMVIDRAFFDFDIDNQQAHQLKKELMALRSGGIHHQKNLQDELKVQLQNLIIDERLAEPAINQAKDFTIKFKESFGSCPMLIFSGFKGCHAYTFFEPVNVDVKKVLSRFAEDIKKTFNYNTLDLSVYGSLNSRVPYSKHQYTDLTVVPFQVDDSYEEITAKSQSPGIEPFTRETYHSSLGELLHKNDSILKQEELRIKEEKIAARANPNKPFKGKVTDHRLFFQSILGEPVKAYPNKEYVMYHCPFQDHDDNNPSFRVYKTGYHCYGCNRKGNYFQFLKDYNGWSDDEVKAHLRANIYKNIVRVIYM